MKKGVFTLVLLLFSTHFLAGQERTAVLLDEGWKFTREDDASFKEKNYNDKKWQDVTIPHDWAIYGPFSVDNDPQEMAIVQDGQTKPEVHVGRTGGLPFVGAGWYRRTLEIPDQIKSKKAILQFDGAMSYAKVYINGKEVGEWPFGYNSFYFDITDFVEPGKNQLAVRLENLPLSSRWYPGAGLYRNVHLLISNPTKIDHWGTAISTERIEKDYAKIKVVTELDSPEGWEGLKLTTELYDDQGNKVAEQTDEIGEYDMLEKTQFFIVKNPKLWGIGQPNLYTAVSKLYKNDELQDIDKNRFGIRTLAIKPNKGFFLNGENIQFKGVNMHHDLGALGAAVNEAAIRRQIRILQDMGTNAIRTSHNMPAPELVRLSDEMGIMLMAETFDEWKVPKMANGYNLIFDDWAEKDIINLVRHFRNSPSIVMWSIGNELPEQGIEGGSKTARFLQDIFHREDPTRPVTQGMDNPDAVINGPMAATMEVPGFNYRTFKYQEAYRKIPQEVVLGSETVSTFSSRGVYKFPVKRKRMAKYDDLQASSYDVEHASWSDLPEDNFIYHDDLPYMMGEFVWTGFDYLGEPTPYYTEWPSRSSLFGIVDLAGIPKDRYYLYRSHWNNDEETLHILPHWNWKGREGEVTPIFVYTNYPSAELFINGKSQGIKKKDMTIDVTETEKSEAYDALERQKRYRLMWMDTKYEPGTVEVVALDENGNEKARKSIKTAGPATNLKLEADRTTIKADGKDLSFITVSLVDKDGNFNPVSDRKITVKVSGKGKFRAMDNGDPSSLEMFHNPSMKSFSGKVVAIIQADKSPGNITVTVSAPGLKTEKITLTAE